MKKLFVVFFAGILMCTMTACTDNGKKQADTTSGILKSEPESTDSDSCLNPYTGTADEFSAVTPEPEVYDETDWDGEWQGEGVSVIIRLSDNYVEFTDTEMKNISCDSVITEGNTITAVYRIAPGMPGYGDGDGANLPEQEWTIIMEKKGEEIRYSRNAVLTWTEPDDDGVIPETVEKGLIVPLYKAQK